VHTIPGPDRREDYTIDFASAVALGLVPGWGCVTKFGQNLDVDTGSDEDVWDGGGTWAPPTQARIHTIASTSVNDTLLGTGSRQVHVYGVSGWLRKDEVVDMNGAGGVSTANAYEVIDRMHSENAGALGVNDGDITATAQTDATVTAKILAGKGQTLMAIVAIATAVKFLLYDYYYSIGRPAVPAAASGDAYLYVKEEADQPDSTWRTRHVLTGSTEGGLPTQKDFKVPITIQGPAIVRLRTTNFTEDNSIVPGGFDGYTVQQ